MRLRTLIGEIGAKYDRRLPMSSEAQMLLRQARVEFEQWIPAGYRAEGSGGTGDTAVATPTIAVLSTDETGTARSGVNLAYVFAEDMSTVTLTLADEIQRVSIAPRTYELKALPDDPTMVADLQRFIELYAVALEAEDAAERKPEEVRPTKVMNRRALLVALAAMPAAVVAPATLGRALGGGAEKAPSEDSAPRFTIDVSQHDWNRRSGNLDWEAVRSAGIAGMCARATYGDPSGYHHPSYHFGDFAGAAKAAGLLVRGGYHNLVRGDQASINRQVDWLRRELDAYDANWAMLDIERYAELVSADMWPRWDDVRRFDDRWAELEDRVLVGYLPPWNWNRYLGQPDLRAFRGPLIASNYPLSDNADEYRRLYVRCGGDKGRGWASYGNRISDGWQFSARAKVPGAGSVCGINAWRMSFDQLKALLTRPA